MDPIMGLPLRNAGVNAVSLADAVKELLSCKAKITENTESEVKAATSTRVPELFALHLFDNGQNINRIGSTL